MKTGTKDHKGHSSELRVSSQRGQAVVLAAVLLATAVVLTAVMARVMMGRRAILVRRGWEEKAACIARGAAERYLLYLSRDELETAPPDVLGATVEGVEYTVSSAPAPGKLVVITCTARAGTPAGDVERQVRVTVFTQRSFEILQWEER